MRKTLLLLLTLAVIGPISLFATGTPEAESGGMAMLGPDGRFTETQSITVEK